MLTLASFDANCRACCFPSREDSPQLMPPGYKGPPAMLRAFAACQQQSYAAGRALRNVSFRLASLSLRAGADTGAGGEQAAGPDPALCPATHPPHHSGPNASKATFQTAV